MKKSVQLTHPIRHDQSGKMRDDELRAVVKYVGGFWPIGVFFSGYGSFFFVPRRQTQTKASSCKYANS